MDPTGFYADSTKKLVESHHRWAILVHLAILVSVLPDRTNAALVALSVAVVIPFNIVTAKLAPRYSVALVEGLRTAGNFAVGAYVYHRIGWPPAAFMWMPFSALASDGGHPRVAYGILGFHAIAYTSLALLDGVPWGRPLAWVSIAIICRVFVDQRVKLAHDMWLASEAQRLAAGSANAKMRREVEARERAELELREAQKLEAIGRLASGLAHEINNPLQFVDNSAELVSESVTQLLERVDRWRRKVDDPRIPENVRAELDHVERQWDLPVLRADVAESLSAMRAGIMRVTNIVRAMKEFAQPERASRTVTDLNRTIEGTLTVARHEYANVAEVTTKLGTLPRVICQRTAISQVLLSLLVNAAHAISQAKLGARGRITVKSWAEADWVAVSVHDNGQEIPAEERDKIFEPFYSTTTTGKPFAQGLGIARSIVEAHDGRLELSSETGAGSTFTFRLPLAVATEKAA